MITAVIVDAIRTPLGRRNGKLKDWHPVDLAAETLKALQQRTGIDPGLIDDVIEPRDSRRILIRALRVTLSKRDRHVAKKHGISPM